MKKYKIITVLLSILILFNGCNLMTTDDYKEYVENKYNINVKLVDISKDVILYRPESLYLL